MAAGGGRDLSRRTTPLRRTLCLLWHPGAMPQLILPTARLRVPFLEADAEFRAEGRENEDLDPVLAAQGTAEAFDDYLRILALAAVDWAVPRIGRVPETTFWWVEGESYIGALRIRPRLDEGLRRYGGHIGYEVRPGSRRRGHASAMLDAALPLALRMGIECALLTCDVDNVPSRRVIERAGGLLWQRDEQKLRYWLPTSATSILPVAV
jgi:predicted acetyltransferase